MQRLNFLSNIIFIIIFFYTLSVRADFSGTVALTSNYIAQGVSQSNNQPAFQTNLAYTFSNGIYLNLWGSSVQFGGSPTAANIDADEGEVAQIEIEYSIGYEGQIADALGYDLMLSRETYPGTTQFDYNQGKLDLNYKIFRAQIIFSNNIYNSGTSGTYYEGGINYTLPAEYFFTIENFSLYASMGYFDLRQPAGQSYKNYKVGISKQYKQLLLDLAWVDTDGKLQFPPLDGQRIVGTISFVFE